MIINKKLLSMFLLSLFWTLTFAYAETVAVPGATVDSSAATVTTSSVSSSDELDELSLDDLDAELSWLDSSASSWASTWTSAGWGYTSTDMIQITGATADTVTLITPVIMDANQVQIKNYKVITSNKSIKDSDPLSMKETLLSFEQITWATLNLVVTGLTADTTYYFVIVPLKDDGVTKVSGNESTESTFVTTSAHSAAANVDLSTANVSYTFTWTKVVLTWTPVMWVDKLEIFLAWEGDKDKSKLWEVAASAWTFEFAVTKSWSYNVTLMPLTNDGTSVWAEYVQKVEIPEIKQQEVVAPKVWPATNMLIAIMLIASLWYVVVRFRRS